MAKTMNSKSAAIMNGSVPEASAWDTTVLMEKHPGPMLLRMFLKLMGVA